MAYTLGEAAALCGVTKNTIRNYEAKGLIAPHRGQGNNYRSFTTHDILVLQEIRAFRKSGCSLEQIGQMLSSANARSMLDTFVRQADDTRAKIQELLVQLNILEAERTKLEAILLDDGATSIVQMEEQCWIPYDERPDRKTHARMICWMEALPYTHMSSFFDETGEAHFGFSAPLSVVRALQLPLCGRSRTLPASSAVRRMVANPTPEPGRLRDVLNDMRQWSAAQGLTSGEAALAVGLITLRDDAGAPIYYSEMLVPLQ